MKRLSIAALKSAKGFYLSKRDGTLNTNKRNDHEKNNDTHFCITNLNPYSGTGC